MGRGFLSGSGGIRFHTPASSVAVPHLLRADVTGFVGREAELAALATAAEERSGLRLVVLAPVPRVPGRPRWPCLEGRAGLYRSLPAGRSVLVVLDNVATVGQVRPLLPGDGRPLMVVTSRSRLSGLTARDGARRIGVGVLDQAEAIDLIQAVTEALIHRNEPGPLRVMTLTLLSIYQMMQTGSSETSSDR